MGRGGRPPPDRRVRRRPPPAARPEKHGALMEERAAMLAANCELRTGDWKLIAGMPIAAHRCRIFSYTNPLVWPVGGVVVVVTAFLVFIHHSFSWFFIVF